MKKFLKFGIIGVSLVIVAIAAIFFLTKASILGTNDKQPQGVSTGSGSSSADKITYNDLDAAAILGALALARQTPLVEGKQLATLITNLTLVKINPTKSNLDMAVKGNRLVDFTIQSNGPSDVICFVVQPPVITGGTPGQEQWVVYFEPKNASKSELLLIKVGITTCDQAKIIADKSENSDRVKLSDDSRAVAKDAALKVPASVLTPLGLVMLDEARGLLNPTPVASPTPTASSVK